MRKEDYRATLILMFGLAAATLTGFLREAALAQQLGVGRSTDIYLIAFTIPEFVFVALPIILSPAFIPLFADFRLRLGEGPAWRFGLRVAAALLALLLGLAILAAAGAPLYLRWLAPGFDVVDRAEALRAEYLMLPALVLMGGATLAGAILQVYRRFARPALATAIYNTVFVVVLLGLPLAWSVGRAAWGVTLGAAAALLIQVTLLWRYRPAAQIADAGPASPAAQTRDAPFQHEEAHRVEPEGAEIDVVSTNALARILPVVSPTLRGIKTLGARWAFWLPRSEPDSLPGGEKTASGSVGVKHLVRLAGPLAAGYAVHHLILFVDRAMATTVGSGGVATLNYAYRLALVVGQLSGLAVSTALFPGMAEQAADRNLDGLRSSLAAGLRFVWMVGLPASLGLVLLREPLVQVIFQRGAFDRTATAAVSDVLAWYALAVLADALCQPLWRVVYARRTTWTVLAVNGLQTGVRLLANFALIGTLGYNGLALSAVLGLSLQALVLAYVVRRQIGVYLGKRWWYQAASIAVGALLAAGMAGLVRGQLAGFPAVWLLLVSGATGGLLYLTTLYVGKKWLW